MKTSDVKQAHSGQCGSDLECAPFVPFVRECIEGGGRVRTTQS